MRLFILSIRKKITNLTRKCCYDRNYDCCRPPRCDAHMNELPIPCEPWQPWYDNRQRLYNRILAGGILWFLFSLGMMIWTESMFLNWSPPREPAPPSDEVCDCCDECEGGLFNFIIDYIAGFYC